MGQKETPIGEATLRILCSRLRTVVSVPGTQQVPEPELLMWLHWPVGSQENTFEKFHRSQENHLFIKYFLNTYWVQGVEREDQRKSLSARASQCPQSEQTLSN